MDILCMVGFDWSYILGEWGCVYIFYRQVGVGRGIFWVGRHFYRCVGVDGGRFRVSGDGWTYCMGGGRFRLVDVYFAWVEVSGHFLWEGGTEWDK